MTNADLEPTPLLLCWQADGVRCAMFTGDGAAAARAAAEAVGIAEDSTHWSLLPEDKLALVRPCSCSGRVYGLGQHIEPAAAPCIAARPGGSTPMPVMACHSRSPGMLLSWGLAACLQHSIHDP